jgi:putative ABC transport system permease protein
MPDRRSVNRSMFWRVIRRSLFANRGRLVVILLALGAGSAVTAALLNLQVDAKRRVTNEFRAFGPNVLIAPNTEGGAASDTLDESLLNKLQNDPDAASIAAIPYLYSVARVSAGNVSRETVVAGTHLDLLENREPGWKLEPVHAGEYASDECVAGVRLANQLRLKVGAVLDLNSKTHSESCRLGAVLSSGAAPDDRLFISLASAQKLAETSGRVSVIEVFVGGDAASINKTIYALQARLKDVEVQPVRQFTEGEARLYGKISGVLTATVAVVLLLTALCVMAAMTNIAAERKNDVGLMKAIGGSVRRVLRIFLAEAALLGLAGGVIGAAAGMVISMVLGKAVFGVAAQPRLIVYPVAVALTVIVAILAAYPLRRLALVRPASVFRGEE